MTKEELIEKISERADVSESERELFFDLLLSRYADELYDEEGLFIPGLGKFEYKKSFDEDENDKLSFITIDENEFLFEIAEKKEADLFESIDSHFSISLGKPVIPLKGSAENKFYIPGSPDNIRRNLELKVEKFLDEISKPEIDSEETEMIEDAGMSLLRRKPPDIEEEINKIEQEFNESTDKAFNKDEDKVTELEGEEKSVTEIEYRGKTEKVDEEEIADEIIPAVYEKNINTQVNHTMEEEINELEKELKNKSEDRDDEIKEVPEEWEEEIIDESDTIEEEIIEEVKNETNIFVSEKENIRTTAGDTAISDAFKFAEEKMARLENFSKKTYAGVIFTIVIVLITAWLIYQSFFTERGKTPLDVQTSEAKGFNAVVERSYDIPVSYPYQAGMFNDVYNSINDEVLTPKFMSKIDVEPGTEVSKTDIPKVPEIKSPAPASRVKGYIYQYGDGTFAVQVSSWRNRSIALSETQKYLDAGYYAFVEQTTLEGEPYYRVRVGGFKSLTEAENFINK